MRKIFDKLTGRDKLKAEIVKLERVSKRLLSRNGGLIQENRELKIRLEYTEQPVEKVEEVQEVLALGFKPFEEVKQKLLKVSKPDDRAGMGYWLPVGYYAISYLDGKPYVLDRAGDKFFYKLKTQEYMWHEYREAGYWSVGSYKFEEVENA